MLDQAESLRRLVNSERVEEIKIAPKKRTTKIITVTSGKGGVGKSNFVVNLAITLQKKGNKVLVFDADVGMGNDDVLMGIYPKYTMFDVINGKEIEDIIEQGPAGVMLLAAGSGLNQIEDLQTEERENFLNKLESLEGYDYIIMDTGAGINKSVLAFISCSEELVLLTTPEPTSLTDAYSLIKATSHFKIKDKANVVVNKTFTEEEGIQTFNKLKKAVDKFLDLDVTYLGAISDDRKLVKSVRDQVPFVIAYPNSDAAREIDIIAEKFINGKEYNAKPSIGAKGVFRKLFGLFS
ncbi:MAG: MinD/ParA family protein [Clostridium sp.]|nr:MinD/ParA family protein [Clostridium sp.]MDY3827779.1 MinD/ParA family protein [Clostridium sp.]